jgi:putative colanic acid biosynthesis acetyltransferase WcaF
MLEKTKLTNSYVQASYPISNRIYRFIWLITYNLLFRNTPRPFHFCRSALLRTFGARIGKNCRIYPHAKIWAPWNLYCEDCVCVADEVILYNPEIITLSSYSTISQQAFLCGASHDYNDPNFPVISAPMKIGSYAWVCARATVQMGANLSEGSVLALGSIATKDLEPWSVYAGIPAKKIKDRNKFV